MNDAYRGALVLGAVVALYLALRLAVVFVSRSTRRRYVAHHVLFLAIALSITAGIIITRMVGDTGRNAALHAQDLVWGVQVSAMIAGLRPLWMHQKDLAARRVPA